MAGPDLSVLTSVIQFGTVTTAVLGVAAALIVVYIAWKGAKMVIRAVTGANEVSGYVGWQEVGEDEYRKAWDSMSDDMKSFHGAWNYEQFRKKVVIER